MACDASSSNLVSSLEKWNQEKSAGHEDAAAPYEKDIAQQLQQEYTLLSSQAMSSDPNRLNEMRQKINSELAGQEASCQMPHMELVEANGGLRVTTGAQKDGFTVKIDESMVEASKSSNRAGDKSGQKSCEKSSGAGDAAHAATQHKPAPKYVPGERPVAGKDSLTQNDLHPKLEHDDHNNMVYKYTDGSSVKFDQSQPPRVSELTNVRGERIALSYRGSAKTPSSFIMTDRNGNVIESGYKGIHDREWNLDTENAGWKVKEAFRGAHITDIGVTDDLQLCMRDKSGNFIEQHRDGDVLKRDASGRITSEVTIVGRTTNFAYHGKETIPSTYTVEDGGGAIIEHGERKNHAWNTFRPKSGTNSLDPGSLNNRDNLVQDPAEKITAVHVNHHNGNSVFRHANGDRTWRPGDDERLWRQTAGGAETIVDRRDNGKPEMQHFVGTDGVKSRYEYDGRGQVLRFTEHRPNGDVLRLSRKDISQDFVDESGQRQKVEATHLADGSVRLNWLERNSAITQRPDGAEVHEFMAKDGRRRVHSTVDTRGTKTEFLYNTTTGEPIRFTVTDPKGAVDVWTIESPIKTGLDNPVWKNQDGTKSFAGSVSVERDGSLKFVGKDGRQTLRTLQGVTLDVTPTAKIVD